MMKHALLLTAVLTLPAGAVFADGGKTISGHCLAVVDGRTLLDGRGLLGDWCSIALAPGGTFRFWKWGLPGAFEVRLEGADGAKAIYFTRNDAASDRVPIGPVRRDSACWIGPRARLCAWSGEDEMKTNREAPYTAFHALLGRNVRVGCGSVTCDWFRYDRATVLAHDDRETLVKIEGETWNTEVGVQGGNRDSVRSGPSFYRCSRTRPAAIHGYVNGWTLQPLAPDGTVGADALAQDDYAGYAAACDGLDHAVLAEEGVQLGYHTDGAAEDYGNNAVPILELHAALK